MSDRRREIQPTPKSYFHRQRKTARRPRTEHLWMAITSQVRHRSSLRRFCLPPKDVSLLCLPLLHPPGQRRRESRMAQRQRSATRASGRQTWPPRGRSWTSLTTMMTTTRSVRDLSRHMLRHNKRRRSRPRPRQQRRPCRQRMTRMNMNPLLRFRRSRCSAATAHRPPRQRLRQ